MTTATKEWWGADVVPRIRLRIVLDGIDYHCNGVPVGYGVAWRVVGRDTYVVMPDPLHVLAREIRRLYWEVRWLLRR